MESQPARRKRFISEPIEPLAGSFDATIAGTYFDRGAKRGDDRWWLYTLEETAAGSA